MIDTLLTSATITDALAETKRRLGEDAEEAEGGEEPAASRHVASLWDAAHRCHASRPQPGHATAVAGGRLRSNVTRRRSSCPP